MHAYCIAPHPSDPRRGGPKPVIFDTQLNDPGRARDLLSRFRAAGYKPVHVAFAAVAVPVSQLGALQRYWDQRSIWAAVGTQRTPEPPIRESWPRQN